jgi:hypothetical protein
MARRSTPERLEAAKREGTVRRLELAGMPRERAEAALRAWETALGGRELSSDEWDAAYREIANARP